MEVDEPFFGYTAVQRFRLAGVEMTRGADVSDTVVWDWGPLANMPRKDPVTQRVALPPRDEPRSRKPKRSTLPCTDVRTGERFALDSDMFFVPSHEDWARVLYPNGKLRAVIDNFPHVLWDNGQGDSK